MGMSFPLSLFLPLGIAGGAVVVVWALLRPRLALVLLLVSVGVGQLFRLPLPGQGGGLLLTDITTVVVVGAAFVQWLRKPSVRLGILSSYLFLTVAIATVSLGLLGISAAERLSFPETAVALLYWFRLIATLLLFPALMVVLSADERSGRTLSRGWYGLVVVLVVGGLIQWLFFSNFTSLTVFGWDPHQGRLTSTFLDPNFFGAFVGLGLCSVLPMVLKKPLSVYRTLLVVFLVVALVLTKSRTSLLAVSVAGTYFGFFMVRNSLRYWTIAKVGLWITGLVWCIGVLIGGVVLLRDRALNLLYTDPTVSLRWQAVRTLIPALKQTVLLGVGYNAYQFYMRDLSVIAADFTLHSRAGSDNTLVTLWITMGVPGVILFVSLWSVVWWQLLVRWLREGNTMALGASAAIILLGVHAQFVNSFLYTHLLIPLIVVMSLGCVRQR